MKTFDIWNYSSNCPLASRLERAVNTCGSTAEHLEAIISILTPKQKAKFFAACLRYWAETTCWDDRNKYAVLVSKRIVEEFSDTLLKTTDDEILKEAYGFTQCAHRYLQNEFFKAIVKDCENSCPEITSWLNEKEFVYADDGKSVIPYKEYRMQKYGY